MKKLIIGSVIILTGILAPHITQAQGSMTYLSNLDKASIGSFAVGSNSWLAASFATGNNADGYVLDSIQLGVTNASGNPGGFTVMLYSAIRNVDFFPGSSLDTLDGSLNPLTDGIYTFTSISNLLLAPTTVYFIVLTAGTAVASGAYESSIAIENYSPSDGWRAPVGVGMIDNYQSDDGSTWGSRPGSLQFAINAIPVPEPGVLGLFSLGGVAFLWHRRRF
jgi:hypothetical protein